MAATERYRNTGAVQAPGTTRRTIFRDILGESLVVAIIGGFAGVCVSTLALSLFLGWLSALTQVTVVMPAPVSLASAAIFVVLVTSVIGGVAALYPAYRVAFRETG